MGISGSQHAPLYAQFGRMRFGATRFGYHSPKVYVSVAGIQRANGGPTPAHKIEDLVINETTNAAPNTATFQASHDWEPRIGDEVIVTLGSINRLRKLFAGTILTVDEQSIDTPAYRVITPNCVDWTWLLDIGDKVTGHFTGSATDIALAIMSGAPAGFTTNQVEAGLPTVQGGITFTNVERSVALERLARRIGAKQRINYDKDLSFRLTPATYITPPRTLVQGLKTLKAVTSVKRDLSQVFTKVPMEGGGSNAAADVEPGETILPLTDAPDWWYGDVGGVVISGPQHISYHGRFPGGGGSLVGTGASPSSAPTLDLAAGSGVTSGSHDVSVVFKTAAGRSLPSPVATIDVGAVAAPTVAVTAGTPSSGGSVDAGSHTYVPVFRTAIGSTTPAPVSNAVTALAGIAAPSAVVYAGTFQNPHPGGVLSAGTYNWKVTLRNNADGSETDGSSATGPLVVSSGTTDMYFPVANVPTPPPGYSLIWYRQKDGGAYKECTNIVLTPGYWFGDLTTEAALGGTIPSSNGTVKGTVLVTDIPVSPSQLVTHVDLYRAFNGGTAKFAFSVDNGVTSASDTLANAGRGADVPASNTAAAGQIRATFAIGASAVTDRELYMSPAGGGARKLALTVANNTATDGIITMSDATLAGQSAEPTSDTSGLSQPSGQVLAGATSIPVAGLGGEDGFQEDGGYAVIGNGQIVVRYDGVFGNTLIGISPTGAGAIAATIAFNSQITAAPALTGIGREILFQMLGNNTSRALRLATGTATDTLAMEVDVDIPALAGVTFKLTRAGAVTGHVWVTLQTGSASPGGTVLATSNVVDAALIGERQPITFTFPTPVAVVSGGAPAYYLVLQGDYTRSDTVNVALNGNAAGFANASQWDGTVVTQVGSVKAWWFQWLAPEVLPIVYPIKKGDPVNLWITVEDLDAQAFLSAQLDPLNLLGGAAGIRIAPPLQDRRKSRAECLAQATAYLDRRARPNVNLAYLSKDVNHRAGVDVDAALAAPTNVSDTFKIQTVQISNFQPSIMPDYVVQASDELFSVEELFAKDQP